jgi:ribosomal protein S18 acetylase RimI-like enzyme
VTRFSEAIWNVDWSAHLPRTLTDDGIAVEYAEVEKAFPFVARNFAVVFDEDPAASLFLPQRMTPAKRRYYEHFADTFEFTHDGRSVGFLICTPVDWSTYYLRFIAVLPEYRGRRLFQLFLPILLNILKAAGVERVEADTSPSNLAIVHILNKFMFNVVGTVMTDRWGSLVRFTKFLNEAGEGTFLRQYCTGIRYQLRGNQQSPR